MKISGAIFDMDGTLTDSMFIWDGIATRYAISCGIKPRADFESKIREFTLEETAEYLSTDYGVTQTAHEIFSGLNAMAEVSYATQVLPKPGIIELLESLKKRGVKMCVATASDQRLAKMVLKKLDMLDYFSEVFTTAMVGLGKDNPLLFETALSHLGTPKKETPVFEDALYAIETAKASGFPVVAVYEEVFRDDQELIKELADVYIRDYRDGVEL